MQDVWHWKNGKVLKYWIFYTRLDKKQNKKGQKVFKQQKWR